ncbi:hypothetical protein BCV70DRAFT_170105 [Testicularia cyperi]|uniref:Uncharacterized protein n=1 Tax=Testicularia cyperi TaxID=1882483 RepID=A0A317Y1G8_9BASI|nr:hypothetical protein BCV70DRAFT_170105 [Testicularia cyperi]
MTEACRASLCSPTLPLSFAALCLERLYHVLFLVPCARLVVPCPNSLSFQICLFILVSSPFFSFSFSSSLSLLSFSPLEVSPARSLYAANSLSSEKNFSPFSPGFSAIGVLFCDCSKSCICPQRSE